MPHVILCFLYAMQKSEFKELGHMDLRSSINEYRRAIPVYIAIKKFYYDILSINWALVSKIWISMHLNQGKHEENLTT